LYRYLLLLAVAALAQAQTGSDIFLAPIQIKKRHITAGEPVNITNRPGYDNQPSFTKTGGILYTSLREDKQADTYHYDLKTKKTDRLTHTKESEFSPTMSADGKTFCTVRVEADQTQRLWRFRGDGTNPELVLVDLKPVGYFAFAEDPNLVVTFILGAPPTLQLADIRSGKAQVIASDIGRPILNVPGRKTISFLQKAPDGVWWIKELDPKTREVKSITKALEGSDYFAWTPQRLLLMTKDAKLYQSDPSGDTAWKEVATFPRKISRVAVNPNGREIAIVMDE
jgi:hypothetical protein